MIKKIVYRGADAYCLQNDTLSAVMLRSGGKVASFKKGNNEFLFQGRSERSIDPIFEGDFGACDLSGFDDMVPTINAGYIEGGVFDGTKLADHGEVWALDWEISMEGEALKAETSGVRLPYRIKKKLFLTPSFLRMEYELSNPTQFALPCLWAAHMLICAKEETRIMNVGIQEVRSTLDMHSNLNGFGALHSWPETTDRQGNPYFLDRLATPYAMCCEKYYFEGKLEQGIVKIKNPDLTLRFDSNIVKHLGIWLNSNGYKGQYNIGIEPATAPMDSPRTAKEWGYQSELAPKQAISWFLELEPE